MTLLHCHSNSWWDVIIDDTRMCDLGEQLEVSLWKFSWHIVNNTAIMLSNSPVGSTLQWGMGWGYLCWAMLITVTVLYWCVQRRRHRPQVLRDRWVASATETCTILYCTVLCCTVLYCTVLYCIDVYRDAGIDPKYLDRWVASATKTCTILYCTVLCCTVLSWCVQRCRHRPQVLRDRWVASATEAISVCCQSDCCCCWCWWRLVSHQLYQFRTP